MDDPKKEERPVWPPPLELIIRGYDETVAFACETCGMVFTAAVAGARELAQGHCMRSCTCGRPLASGMVLCRSCGEKEESERQALLFGRAVKISIDDYPDQPLYWEGHSGSMGVGFFSNVDDLLDYTDDERAGLERRGIGLPKYVWACARRALELSAEDVVTLAGSVGESDLEEASLTELQDLLDGWCQKQGVRTWAPDFTRAVLLT